jgi:hypothetical protein
VIHFTAAHSDAAAQRERELMSKRTKDAPAAAKKRDQKLGGQRAR